MSSSFAFPGVPPRACCSWRYNSSRIPILIELAVGKTWSAFFRMARSSVRSTIAMPITPSNRSAISSTRASSFFQNKSPFAGEDFCSAKTLPTNVAATATIVAPIRVIRLWDFRAILLSFFERTLDCEERGIEVCERLFQLLQFHGRAMHFYAGEIGHGEHFREQCANVVQMCEKAFGIGVTFAAENFVTVNTELIEKILLLGCGFLDETREPSFDRLQLSRMHFEVWMQTNELR